MKDLITIGLPSKGRLKEKSISFFNDKGLKVIQSEKERNYFGTIENKPNVKIIFLHAKEIIQRLGDGTLDIGISGLDLLKEGLTHLEPVGILLLGLADLGGGSGFLELKVFASVAYVGCRIYRAKPVH